MRKRADIETLTGASMYIWRRGGNASLNLTHHTNYFVISAKFSQSKADQQQSTVQTKTLGELPRHAVLILILALATSQQS